MTLDEAIKHAEEVAEENEKSLKRWKECKNRGTVGWSDFDKEKVDTSITRCGRCAEEHRQLAEWLKELKHLRNLVAYSIDFHCTIEKAEKKLRVAEDKIAYIESLNKGEV